MIGKLLGVATAGSALASLGLLSRFLSGIASMVALAIVSAFMLCALLMGGFYASYSCLVHNGLDPVVAQMTVGVAALFVTIVSIALTIHHMKRLYELLPLRGADRYPSALPEVAHLVDAFLDGFLHPGK